ncbi:MAG: VOC family protein [Acidobacteria bacterium]|nr:VOC family protein [Acidobacteriota bacterium]
MLKAADTAARKEADSVALTGTDHVEFYVGNARQSAHYYRTAFGMRLIAYQGPETGIRDRASYVLEQGNIRLVLTTALADNHPIADHVLRHGDGVRTIALAVTDAKEAYWQVKARGGFFVEEPTEIRDEHGVVRMFSVATYGETVHTFVERGQYHGPFLPGYVAVESDSIANPVGLRQIDQIVGNVAHGEQTKWAAFYENVMGFGRSSKSGDCGSSVLSKTTTDGQRKVRFPIQAPSDVHRQCRVEEFLESYDGPGVQRIALASDDIVETVQKLRARGVEFLSMPLGANPQPGKLSRLGIVADRDEEGSLLRIATMPIGDRPTVYYEIIERV